MPATKLTIDPRFEDFINQEVLPHSNINSEQFWPGLEALVDELSPKNRALLAHRDKLQAQIDDWHHKHRANTFDPDSYKQMLQDIGYLVDCNEDFQIAPENVDTEIACAAGPQLVVPLKNARFALNAVNARWGSLYDALYGTDALLPLDKAKTDYDPVRGAAVIKFAKDFLDHHFPLDGGSHQDATHYAIDQHSAARQLLVTLDNGKTCVLQQSEKWIGHRGYDDSPEAIILCNNQLHLEISIDRSASIGKTDAAGINDILLESALTTIMDCEDSVAAVDCEDKLQVYRNWLGLIRGDLTIKFEKNGRTVERRMSADRQYIATDGSESRLSGRSLLFNRNVGHLMSIDIVQDSSGNDIPEGILDAVVTVLISAIELQSKKPSAIRNSQHGSIYIVKPKMHGPEEVAFACELFDRIETLYGLPPNTVKLGIMDEERRTTVNLKSCIQIARHRLVFINTGFLDRTGDEIHTSMHAGAFLPKADLKQATWIQAYENWNVDIGLDCGLAGKGQIGKGMWVKPDEMAAMMREKIAHPLAGANTAWVPSPTAATLHALHYHEVDVKQVQQTLTKRKPASVDDILTLALCPENEKLSNESIERELTLNLQAILGYVVRWIDQGVGCSKVPDLDNVFLMEDRATLRIASQLIANWLHHGICEQDSVINIMKDMARLVDEQNAGDSSYQPMSADFDNNLAVEAAKKLIFEGANQPNGYTEPLLHEYRRRAKTGP